MAEAPLFADIILPLPVPGLFTYAVPKVAKSRASLWKRAAVQFGSRKLYTGIIVRIHTEAPVKYSPKTILSILDDDPVINEIQYRFWLWMAGYYLCAPGEVMHVALPSSLKLSSESFLVMNPAYDGDMGILEKTEIPVVEALSAHKKINLSQISDLTGRSNVMSLVRTLTEKGVVLPEEELVDTYKPLKETVLMLSEEYTNEEKLHEVFDSLQKRAFKQLEALMLFLKLAGYTNGVQKKEVLKRELLALLKNTAGPLSSLVSKGILTTADREVSRLGSHQPLALPDSIVLTKAQEEAMNRINLAFMSKEVVLLHGITSSGKTEMYIRLIRETIDEGKQALYLLPEIALTTQIITRLRKYFGDAVGVYHSRYNASERVEIWNRTLGNQEKRYQVVLGPRSALFLPFDNLGLIIVDEEHDTSFKQHDPAPRYNARDAAVYLASLHKAKVILGSATPSVESYFNAKGGKYGLVELTQRYGDVQLPEILVADMKSERKKKTLKSHFSSILFDHITRALENSEQVILFQNRRGFSLRLECDQCNWMPQCVNCDVTLIYHKFEKRMRCHYCGYAAPVPGRCVLCGSTGIVMRGFGTEQVEEDMNLLFPEAVVKRMDMDTTRSKNAYQSLISDFEKKKIQVLVGTQMVTKGLDFDDVGVVGILNADNMISFPDFRSYERSFQLMVQVAGRAGRKNNKGTVVIQTNNPGHSVIDLVIRSDYQSMYQHQILERRNFRYPPFFRLIRLTLKHSNDGLLNKAAQNLAQMLRKRFAKQILGPEYPLIPRIKNLYIKNIMVKLARTPDLAREKNDLVDIIAEFHALPENKRVRVIVDVDPQ